MTRHKADVPELAERGGWPAQNEKPAAKPKAAKPKAAKAATAAEKSTNAAEG